LNEIIAQQTFVPYTTVVNDLVASFSWLSMSALSLKATAIVTPLHEWPKYISSHRPGTERIHSICIGEGHN